MSTLAPRPLDLPPPEADARPLIHVVQHLRPGGLEVMALELARAQSASRPTFVLSLDGTAEEAIAAWPRLAALRDRLIFCAKRPGLDFALLLRLQKIFATLRPIAVHTHHIGPLLYAGIAARLAGVPNVLHTEHDAWHLNDKSRRRLARAAIRLARPRVIADAPHVARAFAEALHTDVPRVVLNGVDTQRFTPGNRTQARATLGLAPTGQIIGIAARLETVKGVDIGLDAFAKLPGRVRLAIAGTGTQEITLRQQAKTLGIADRVNFLGHVEHMDVFYRAIDVLCQPSRNEGMPLAPLEAQASGTPVIATRVGGVAAAIAQSTQLVPPNDPDALARALASILAKPPANPRDFVIANASLSETAQTYLRLARAA